MVQMNMAFFGSPLGLSGQDPVGLRLVEPTARRGSAAWKVKSRDTFIGLRLVEMSLRLGELGAEDQKGQPALCRQQHPLPYFTLGVRQMPGLQNSGIKCPKNL